MLEWLLKYPPELFHQGSIVLAWPWAGYAAAVALIAAVVLGLGYRRAVSGALDGRLDRWRGSVLGLLRTALLAVLLLALLGPLLVVSLPAPIAPRIAVLLDDSLSMGVDDVSGDTRAAAMLQRFAPGVGSVATALEERFDVRYFRYGTDTREIIDTEELTFREPRSDLAGAIDLLANEHEPSRPAALVVVGDGGWRADSGLRAAVAAARARGIQIHTVGVGAERFEKDLEIVDVRIPASVLRDERLDAEIAVRHRGYAGKTVRLAMDVDGVLAREVDVTLPLDDAPLSIRLPVALDVSGLHRLVFRLDRQDGERIVANNVVERAVEVSDVPLDVLHVEGEPRFEVKFLRRALADDGNLRLASLVRTAENKFLRLGVLDETELASGFPSSAEELFRYRVLVLGSLEAAALSDEQHALIREFVARRGGGLLLLGGRLALAEGGYGASPLAAMLPVRLDRADERFLAAVKVRPVGAVSRDPILRLDPARVTPWGALPPLTVVNPVRRVKPGATVSLEGVDRTSRSWVLLARHRYGKGRVAVMPVRDSWRWQMHASIPTDDLTHELFWRQLLRWLARDAGTRIEITRLPEDGVPGEAVTVALETVGADFSSSALGEVRFSLLTPPGDIVAVEPVQAPGRAAARTVSFVPDVAGIYELQAELLEDGEVVGRDRRLLAVNTQGGELFGAELARDSLQRMAEENGGQYTDIAGAEGLPAAISVAAQGAEVTRRLPLWDAPILMLLLIVAAAAEWLLRRRWGLA